MYMDVYMYCCACSTFSTRSFACHVHAIPHAYILDMYALLYSYNHATPSAAHPGGGIYNCDDYMTLYIVMGMSISLYA